MNERIEIKKATKKEFQKLFKLDFSNTYKKMFSISQDDNKIKINEVELEKPIINESKGYVDEMKYYVDELDKSEVLSLIAYVDSKPAGYIFTYKQEIDDKIIFNIDGILVAKKFQKFLEKIM